MASPRQVLAIEDDPVCVEPYLYVGSERNAIDASLLERLNIRAVVCLAAEVPSPSEAILSQLQAYVRIPLRGVDDEPLRPHFDALFGFLDGALSSGLTTLIHCSVPTLRARSSSILMAYLMHRHRFTIQNAYDFLKKSFPVRPLSGHLRQLADFEKDIKERGGDHLLHLSSSSSSSSSSLSPSVASSPSNASSSQQQQQQPSSSSQRVSSSLSPRMVSFSSNSSQQPQAQAAASPLPAQNSSSRSYSPIPLLPSSSSSSSSSSAHSRTLSSPPQLLASSFLPPTFSSAPMYSSIPHFSSSPQAVPLPISSVSPVNASNIRSHSPASPLLADAIANSAAAARSQSPASLGSPLSARSLSSPVHNSFASPILSSNNSTNNNSHAVAAALFPTSLSPSSSSHSSNGSLGSLNGSRSSSPSTVMPLSARGSPSAVDGMRPSHLSILKSNVTSTFHTYGTRPPI